MPSAPLWLATTTDEVRQERRTWPLCGKSGHAPSPGPPKMHCTRICVMCVLCVINIYIYIYIYIYREREREKKRERERDYVYAIYIYIYIYREREREIYVCIYVMLSILVCPRDRDPVVLHDLQVRVRVVPCLGGLGVCGSQAKDKRQGPRGETPPSENILHKLNTCTLQWMSSVLYVFSELYIW